MNQEPIDNSPSNQSVVPAGQSPVPPTTTPSLTPQKKNRHKKGWLIGGIVASALALLVGGGALAYNLWYQNPEKVVYDAIIHAFKQKTSAFTGDLTVTTDEVTVNVKLDGRTDGADGELDATVRFDSKQEGADLSLNVDASLISEGETAYVKLKGLKDAVKELEKSMGDAPEYVTKIVDRIEDRWVSIKASDYADVDKELAAQQTCTSKVFEKLNTDDTMRDEVVDLYVDNKIVVVKEKIGSKSIDGVGSLGYKIDIDKDATENFVRNLGDTAFGKALVECDKSIDFKEMADDIKRSDDSGDKVTIELWVSRFSHQATQVSLSGKSDDTAVNFILKPLYDQEVSIKAPTDTVSLKDLMKEIQDAVADYYSSTYDDPSLEYDDPSSDVNTI